MEERAQSEIQVILRLMRRHLGMDVAFVSHLTDDVRVLRFVDLASERCVLEPGQASPASDSYCHHIVRGALPGLLPDARRHPVSAAIEATHTLPVGTHLSVPIVFGDGEVYGTLCAFAHELRPDLDERDLETMRVLADVIAAQVERFEEARRELASRAATYGALQPGRDLRMVFQPIMDLSSGGVVGVEALARFPGLGRGPAEVFADAAEAGVGVELELAAAELGLAVLGELPPEVSLSLNVSPLALVAAAERELVVPGAGPRVVLELTEHAAIADYAEFQRALSRHRARGVRLAIDDVGTGFAGLDQILQLQPDLLKLDGSLVSAIDERADKQAMVAAIATYAAGMGLGVIAERIETTAERDTLMRLGLTLGQGYALGWPAPLDELRVRW